MDDFEVLKGGLHYVKDMLERVLNGLFERRNWDVACWHTIIFSDECSIDDSRSITKARSNEISS